METPYIVKNQAMLLIQKSERDKKYANETMMDCAENWFYLDCAFGTFFLGKRKCFHDPKRKEASFVNLCTGCLFYDFRYLMIHISKTLTLFLASFSGYFFHVCAIKQPCFQRWDQSDLIKVARNSSQ